MLIDLIYIIFLIIIKLTVTYSNHKTPQRFNTDYADHNDYFIWTVNFFDNCYDELFELPSKLTIRVIKKVRPKFLYLVK